VIASCTHDKQLFSIRRNIKAVVPPTCWFGLRDQLVSLMLYVETIDVIGPIVLRLSGIIKRLFLLVIRYIF